MIRFLGQLPKKCTVAFSGGVDSVAVADFLLNGKREVELAFFHHGTSTSDEAEHFVRDFSHRRGLRLSIGRIRDASSPVGLSQEEYWREERYSFLLKFQTPVVTCHHLDDAVETWVFTSLHGKSRLIPYSRGNVLRPFLLTKKSDLVSWVRRRGLQWSEDQTNLDLRHPRNLIRHVILPEALKVNPGLHKMVKKKYLTCQALS